MYLGSAGELLLCSVLCLILYCLPFYSYCFCICLVFFITIAAFEDPKIEVQPILKFGICMINSECRICFFGTQFCILDCSVYLLFVSAEH